MTAPRVRGDPAVDELLFLAGELAALCPDLPAEESRALRHLTLALLVLQGQGSSCLPLASPVLESSLRGALLPAGVDETALQATLGWARGLGARLQAGELGALSALLGHPGARRPLIVDGERLYPERLHRLEVRLAEGLRQRQQPAPAGTAPLPGGRELEAALAVVLETSGGTGAGGLLRLSAEQTAAVRAALMSRVALISGGPGTGKTSIVLSLLRVLAQLGLPAEAVGLAAPTGKAKARLEEAIRRGLAGLQRPTFADAALLRAPPRAETLHRLLGFWPEAARQPTGIPGWFRHHEHNRLAQRVLIVDEASMIDLFLMERLLAALRDDAQLLLIGDRDQLPSVDAGAVFRDLALAQDAGAGMASLRLTRSYRMNPEDPDGRQILTLAHAVRDGVAAPLGELPEAGGAEAPGGHGVTWLRADSTTDRAAFLLGWYRTRVAAAPELVELCSRTYVHQPALHAGGFSPDEQQALLRLFAHFESHRVLCVTRRETALTGAEGVNAHLHRLRWLADPTERGGGAGAEPDYLPGEPVLQRRNDYARQLFNGDQGLVVRVLQPGQPGGNRPRLMVLFPRGAEPGGGAGLSLFSLDALRPGIGLCYASTVHVAQGSEYDEVALVLPERDLPLLSRELLYTAITRSRRSVILVGQKSLFERGVARRLERHSGLVPRLTPSRP